MQASSHELGLDIKFEVNVIKVCAMVQIKGPEVVHNSQYLLNKKHKSSKKGEKNE